MTQVTLSRNLNAVTDALRVVTIPRGTRGVISDVPYPEAQRILICFAKGVSAVAYPGDILEDENFPKKDQLALFSDSVRERRGEPGCLEALPKWIALSSTEREMKMRETAVALFGRGDLTNLSNNQWSMIYTVLGRQYYYS